MNNESVTIRATVAFPSFEKLDTMANKYSVQLANLSPAAAEKLEELGINVTFKDDDKYGRGHFINCKSKFPIIPKDVDGNSFEGMTNKIGYGSVVRAVIKPVEWSMGGKTGVSPRLQVLIVDELIEPESAGGSSLDDAL